MLRVLDSCADVLTCFSRRVNGPLFILAGISLIIMVIPTILDVLSRAVFSRSLAGTLEVVAFAQCLLVFASLGYIQDEDSHIRVTLLTERLSPLVRNGLELFNRLVPLGFIALSCYSLVLQGISKQFLGETSNLLLWPLHYFLFFGALGAAAFALSLLAGTLRVLAGLCRNGEYLSLLGGLTGSLLMFFLAVYAGELPLASDLRVLGATGLFFLMVVILLGMPIGLAMGVVGYIGMLAMYPGIESSLSMLGMGMYNTAANYGFCIVPMYILMGELAKNSGISRDLFQAASMWLGGCPGGMAMASLAGCAGFAAVSGDSMATAVSMGSVALPEMRKKNYHPGFSCATLAAGGTLGILIPPSTGFIFYSLVTEVSIGKLFMAGVVPGILLTVFFIIVVYGYARLYPGLAPAVEKTSFREKVVALKGVTVMVLLVGFILLGILLGWFSPSEGGAVGAAVTFLYALARRRLTWKGFLSSVSTTVTITSELFLVLIGVGLLGYFFAATALPFDLADMVVGMHVNKYVVFVAIVVFYIIMGCLLNVIPMMLLTLPAIYPTVLKLGFDPVWFGVVAVVLMEMGQITPPVGINVFAMGSVASDIPLSSIFAKILPFFLCMILLVFMLLLFPELALWLPGILF